MKAYLALETKLRDLLGGWEAWIPRSKRVEIAPPDHDGEWRIYCGEGRYDAAAGNAAVAQRTGIALNWQITGGRDGIVRTYVICVAWPGDDAWQLMFHRDPDHEEWPTHALHHLQVAHATRAAIPPFASWRIPIETDPYRLLEYVVAQIR